MVIRDIFTAILYIENFHYYIARPYSIYRKMTVVHFQGEEEFREKTVKAQKLKGSERERDRERLEERKSDCYWQVFPVTARYIVEKNV